MNGATFSMREKWGLSLWRPIDKRHLRGLMDGLQEGPAAGDSSGSGHPPPSQSDHMVLEREDESILDLYLLRLRLSALDF